MAKRRATARKAAGAAKTTRAAGKRKRASASKRRTTKRASAGGKRPDRCQELRDERDRLVVEIREIEEQLSDFDIPQSTRRKLESLLRRKQARLRFVQQQLAEC
jgi:hypothetical protein